MADEIEKYIVVSYVPLLSPTVRIMQDPSVQYAAATKETTEEIGHAIEQTPDAHVKACVWMIDQSSGKKEFYPVFLLDNANEVLDHLLYWTENDVRSWFSLYLEKIDDNRYVAMLFPNLSKSIQRFKLSCLQHSEYIPESGADYTLIFKPLEFLSQVATVFDKVNAQLTDEIKLGFLNTADFDQDHPENCVDKIRCIGPITRVRKDDTEGTKYITSYMQNYVENLEKDDE